MDEQIDYVTVPAIVAKGIDYLDRLSKHRSPEGIVETDKDWHILREMFKVWLTVYPLDAKDFVDNARTYKTHNQVSKGIIKEHGGAMIQHKLEVPEKLYKMIELMFPRQNFDKEFVEKLMSELPILNVTKF